MGLFGYFSPEEYSRMKRDISHYKEFFTLHGYKDSYTIDPENSDRYLPRNSFITPEGIECKTADEFYKVHKWYPCLEKNGVCYGYWEPADIHCYVYPFQDEVKFLTDKGYARLDNHSYDLYLVQEQFYKENGYIPRWEKDGEQFGHGQLLKKEGYIYYGEPPI